jgi:hypothetical protein
MTREWWARFKHAAREIARRMPVSDFERVDGLPGTGWHL